MKKVNRIGEKKLNKWGDLMQIVEYKDSDNIVVRFKGGNTKEAQYTNFKLGNIKNDFAKTVYNVGIIGDIGHTDGNGKNKDSYFCWLNMLRRCYNKEFQEKNPAYKGCTVCKDWLYYPNFAVWYNLNYYEVNNCRMHMDKDIKDINNKVYSPENCCFVPQTINSYFRKINKKDKEWKERILNKLEELKNEMDINVYNLVLDKIA